MKKYYLLILASIILFATSCNKEESGDKTTAGSPAVATFTITTPITYATTDPGSTDENRISHLEFYTFNDDGSRDGVTSYHKADVNPNDALDPVSFLVGSGTDKTVLVAINLNLGNMGTDNLSQVEKKIIDQALKLTEVNSQDVPSIGPGMSGTKKNIHITADKLNNEVKIEVSRLVSKINPPIEQTGGVTVNLSNNDIEEVFGNQLDQNNSKITFKLKSYAVINGLELSQAFTHDGSTTTACAGWDHWDRTSYWIPGYGYQRSTFESDGSLKTAYSGRVNGSYWLLPAAKIPVYIYENDPLKVSSSNGLIQSGYDRETVYAYLIEADLIHSDDPTNPKTRYWRINLVPEDAYQIFRNSIYNITLQEVRTKGYGTAKEAEEDKDGGEDGGKVIPGSGETGIKADIEIVHWQVKTSGVKF